LNGTAITTGTVANARTTASSSNGASTIVARDASGNFSAGTITATLNGNASTATSATSATTATNQSGGTVAATTGTFSTSAKVNAAAAYLYVNRNSSGSGEMGLQFQNAASTLWYNYVATGGTSIIWDSGGTRMTLTTGGDLTCVGNVTAYSDERVKTNWRDLQPDFIEQLAKVKHGIYDRTDQESTQIGVGAQSLRPVMEHAVMEDAEGKLSVAYGNAALVAAIELAKQVVELKKEIELLKAK
jgi:hypothetical protein